MAIDCKSPCSPYEDEVKTFLDAYQVPGISLGLSEEAPPQAKKAGDQIEIDVPAHEDDQSELHARDISNVTEDTTRVGGMGVQGAVASDSLSFSLRVGDSYTTMDTSMASTSLMDFSGMEHSTRSRTSKLSKEERKKNKRLNKKKNKYSQMLTTGNNSNNKSFFTLGDLINDFQGNEPRKDAADEEEDNQSYHQSFPAPRGSRSGITLAALVSDLRAEDEEDEEENDEGVEGKKNISSQTSTTNPAEVKGEINGSKDNKKDCKLNEGKSLAHGHSRSHSRKRQSSGKLPPKSKSVDKNNNSLREAISFRWDTKGEINGGIDDSADCEMNEEGSFAARRSRSNSRSSSRSNRSGSRSNSRSGSRSNSRSGSRSNSRSGSRSNRRRSSRSNSIRRRQSRGGKLPRKNEGSTYRNNTSFRESSGTIPSAVTGETKGSNEGNENSEPNQGSLFTRRRSRSNIRTRRSSGKLPRKSKSMDDSDKERFKAIRHSLINNMRDDSNVPLHRSSTGTAAVAAAAAREAAAHVSLQRASTGGAMLKARGMPQSTRQESEKSKSAAKDGLAAISVLASTNTRPKEIGRKIKLQRALSDYGNKSCGVLDLEASERNIKNDNELSPVADPKVDRRRSIKKTVNDLAAISQQRPQEGNFKGKSPVPVRMPSRRSVGPKGLPTTAITSRAAATKLGSVAAAGGIVIPRAGSSIKSFATSNSERKLNVEDPTHGGISANDFASSRRQIMSTKLSKSERTLSVSEASIGIIPRATQSFSARSRSRSSSKSGKKTTTPDDAASKRSSKSEGNISQPAEAASRTIPRASKSFTTSKSERKLKMSDMSDSVRGRSCCAMSRRETIAAKLSKSERYLSVDELNLSQSHQHNQHHRCTDRNTLGDSSCNHRESVSKTNDNDGLSRSVHGTRDTETPRHVRRSRASAADFDWKKFASK